MRARAGLGRAWVAAALALLVPAAARALPGLSLPAPAAPEVVVGVGSTFAVDGEPGSGGAAAALELLWPVTSDWAFGAALFAEDLGTGFANLRDPNTREPLGTVASAHRWAFGGEWRGAATLLETKHTRWLLGGGFGYGRQERDQRGTVNDAVSGVTGSAGGTFVWQSAHGQALGLAIAYRLVLVDRDATPGRSTRWVTGRLEWRWRSTRKN